MEWDVASGGANPTDAALATGTNWDKAVANDKPLARGTRDGFVWDSSLACHRKPYTTFALFTLRKNGLTQRNSVVIVRFSLTNIIPRLRSLGIVLM